MLIFDQLNKADRHLRALAWVIGLGMLVLLGGLWWVQVVKSRQYVEDQRTQSYRTVRVPAPRGKILDREGVVLAENHPVYNVSLYLEDRGWRDAVQKEYKLQEAAARKTAVMARRPKLFEKILSSFGYKPSLTQARKLTSAEKAELGKQARYTVTSNIVWQLSVAVGRQQSIDEKLFHQHYEVRRALPLTIIRDLQPPEIARFQEQTSRLPGVDMDIQPVREYPQKTLACHVVGCLIHSDDLADGELASYNYQLPDYKGYAGIEAALDDELRGRAGATAVLVNNMGYRQSETILSPVEAGRNVTLTIDSEIQRIAEEELGKAAGAMAPIRGAVVVMDVRSGEVIALASAPAFDPKDWVPFLPKAIWETYTNQDIAPLMNRAIYGNFFPGSTFKIVVALAGFDRGTLDPEEVIYVEPNRFDPSKGAFYLENRNKPWRDTAPPGEYKFKLAFIKSSNSYFIQQGLRAGAEAITTVALHLGFGQKTGILLPDSPGILPTPQNQGGWSAGNTCNFSIGQQVAVTPLQLAVAISAVANGGKILVPQLVLHTTAQNELVPPAGTVSVKPIVRNDLHLNERALSVIREAMLADVEDPAGTGSKAYVQGYRVCGKTGTAQVELHGSFHHHTVWFGSYAPAEDPHYAVVVMVDYERGGSGGGTGAPIAQKIYERLKYRDTRSQPPRSTIAIR